MRYLFIIIVYCFSTSLFAYNSAKCNGLIKKLGWGYGTAYLTTTSSYISSTGDCSATAYHSKENKKMYYAQNKLELKLDIAKGGGPYLSELTSVYGCSNKSKTTSALMNNFKAIYESKDSFGVIESVLQNQDCKYL